MGRVVVFVMALSLVACSSGLQERAFKDESGSYIVSRSLVNDRVTAGQPHISGAFACDTKITSEQMVELKKDGAEHSWYTQCQPLEKYRPFGYVAVHDQPIGTLYQGPISAAILGASVGTGLALSGDTVTQQGGGASASARSRVGKGGRR